MEPKLTFLIAEDDPDDQFLIQTVAKDICPPEIQMHFVGDGIELLDFLLQDHPKKPRPSLIVLDLNMPRKDGREALKEIRSNPEIWAIPAVVLTTSNIEEDVQYCQQLGIDGYYRKPGTIAELREIIQKLCTDYFE